MIPVIEWKIIIFRLIALSQVAKSYNYVRPLIVKEKKILINGGRHPVIEQKCTYIPNDTLSAPSSDLINILIGPSCCGKSTYLQQIALIVFMAHIGSYVPANEAIIGLVSQICCKISTCESSSLESSSFLQDIRQVNIVIMVNTC